MSEAEKNDKTEVPWWTFDECRVCTILRLLAMGAVIGACLVGIWILVMQ